MAPFSALNQPAAQRPSGMRYGLLHVLSGRRGRTLVLAGIAFTLILCLFWTGPDSAAYTRLKDYHIPSLSDIPKLPSLEMPTWTLGDSKPIHVSSGGSGSSSDKSGYSAYSGSTSADAYGDSDSHYGDSSYAEDYETTTNDDDGDDDEPEEAPKFHLVMLETSNEKVDMCKSITSGMLGDYPPPNVIHWTKDFSSSTKVGSSPHLGKMEAVSDFLSSEKVSDDDLVILIDGFGIGFQLPSDVLLSQYRHIIHTANARLDKKYRHPGRYRETIVWAAGKLCWPNPWSSTGCKDVPDSPLPANMYGDLTDEGTEGYRRRPRFLEAGAVIGPAKDLLKVWDAAREIGLENDRSARYIFGEMFGLQQRARKRGVVPGGSIRAKTSSSRTGLGKEKRQLGSTKLSPPTTYKSSKSSKSSSSKSKSKSTVQKPLQSGTVAADAESKSRYSDGKKVFTNVEALSDEVDEADEDKVDVEDQVEDVEEEDEDEDEDEDEEADDTVGYEEESVEEELDDEYDDEDDDGDGPDLDPSRNYEFSMGLDYSSLLWQSTERLLSDEIAFVVYDDISGRLSKVSNLTSSHPPAPHMTLPSSLAEAAKPYHYSTTTSITRRAISRLMPRLLPSNADPSLVKKTSKLLSPKTTWREVPLAVNTYTGSVPVALYSSDHSAAGHHTASFSGLSASGSSKDSTKSRTVVDVRVAYGWWDGLWFQSGRHARELLRLYVRHAAASGKSVAVKATGAAASHSSSSSHSSTSSHHSSSSSKHTSTKEVEDKAEDEKDEDELEGETTKGKTSSSTPSSSSSTWERPTTSKSRWGDEDIETIKDDGEEDDYSDPFGDPTDDDLLEPFAEWSEGGPHRSRRRLRPRQFSSSSLFSSSSKSDKATTGSSLFPLFNSKSSSSSSSSSSSLTADEKEGSKTTEDKTKKKKKKTKTSSAEPSEYTFASGRGGVWSSGELLSWGQFCGGTEEEVFGDGEGGWSTQ